MKQSQFNFLNMLGGVLNGMNNERSKWEGEPEISSAFSLLQTGHDQVINLAGTLSATDLTGLTARKDNTFDNLIGKTYKLAKKMSAYAKKNNNLTLLPLVNIAYSALSRGPEIEAVNRCAGIADKASGQLNNLISFKVTDAEIEVIRQLIIQYRQESAERTALSKDKPVKGSEISDILYKLRSDLDIMDDLVKGIIDDQEFIARYKSWRNIINYGKGKTLKNNTEETGAA